MIPYAGAERPEDFPGTSTVVIDILRATTTMTYAMEMGAREIWPVASVAAGRTLHEEKPGTILGGEVDLEPPPGFDLGNSPLDYSREAVAGRDVILATTNGTKALAAAAASRRLFVMSLRNLEATVRTLPHDTPLVLFASGRVGEVAEEDLVAAGGILAGLGEAGSASAGDPWAERSLALWREACGDLPAYLLQTPNGRRLEDVGRREDVVTAGAINQADFALPVIHGRVGRG